MKCVMCHQFVCMAEKTCGRMGKVKRQEVLRGCEANVWHHKHTWQKKNRASSKVGDAEAISKWDLVHCCIFMRAVREGEKKARAFFLISNLALAVRERLINCEELCKKRLH